MPREGRTIPAPRPRPGNPWQHTTYCKDSGASQESTKSREYSTCSNTYRKNRARPVPTQPVCIRLSDSKLPVQQRTRNPLAHGTLLHLGKTQATSAQGQCWKNAGVPGTNWYKRMLEKPCTMDNALGQAWPVFTG